jgi:heme/copper-type cytochrome/quinol oxidase subunit 1
MIRIPTRVKVFTWCLNIIDNHVFCSVPLFWAALFIWLFTLRRVTRIVLSNASVDLILHDTYFVVAHFHYVLSIGATAAIIMRSIHYWPIFTGLFCSEVLCYLGTFLFAISVNRVFFPIHSLRVERMPRRYINYSFLMTSANKFIGFILISTIVATIILLVSLKTFLSNFFVHSINVNCTEFLYGIPVKWHSWEERRFKC